MEVVMHGKAVKVENEEVEVIIIQKGCLNSKRELMVEAIDLLRHQCE